MLLLFGEGDDGNSSMGNLELGFSARRHFPGKAGFKRGIARGLDMGLPVTLTRISSL